MVETLVTLVDLTLSIEKLRIQTGTKQTYNFKNGTKELFDQGRITKKDLEDYDEYWKKYRVIPAALGSLVDSFPLGRHQYQDEQIDTIYAHLVGLEAYVDGEIAKKIEDHPAWPWFSRVKGVGDENIAKIVGLLDISKAPHPSSFCMYAGFAPDEDGKSMKRVKGEKVRYNQQLRSMCWRLSVGLKMAQGVFYDYYIKEKEKYLGRFANQGIKVLPTPAGKYVCANCGESFTKKPGIADCCNNQKISKVVREEPAGVMWLGHVDNMAVRKMIKLFLICLHIEWAIAVGLPAPTPYPIGQLGHSHIITPEEMTDRPPRKKKNK